MRNTWRIFMISKGYKKHLIINAYNMQLLLPFSDMDSRFSIDANKRIINLLLLKIYQPLWVEYKCKNININYDIGLFLTYLINPIYSIYQYGGRNEKSDVQKDMSSHIKEILRHKQKIEDSPDYMEYLEDIYD